MIIRFTDRPSHLSRLYRSGYHPLSAFFTRAGPSSAARTARLPRHAPVIARERFQCSSRTIHSTRSQSKRPPAAPEQKLCPGRRHAPVAALRTASSPAAGTAACARDGCGCPMGRLGVRRRRRKEGERKYRSPHKCASGHHDPI